MEIKSQFLNLGSFILKNGTQVSFWEDTWLGDQPLNYQFPSLFNIVRKKMQLRALTENKLTEWHNLVIRSANVSLIEGNDMFRWNLHSNGSFTVQSMYKHLINNNTRVSKDVWRTWLPLKIKIFMWYFKRGVLLTKDNLNLRQFNISFSSVLMPNSCGSFQGSSLASFMVKLQQSEERTQVIVECCRQVETVALQVFASFGWPNHGVKGDLLEIEGWEVNSKAIVRNRCSNFRWAVIIVYGPAQHCCFSELILEEIYSICDKETLPVVLGGDFNLIREVKEKSSFKGDHKYIDMFNRFIARFQLREVTRGGGGRATIHLDRLDRNLRLWSGWIDFWCQQSGKKNTLLRANGPASLLSWCDE
ncbi:hypothetical protein U9M48_036890 [Paspalum notatum var. saurae]|uniref:Reverse transcriptase zinc-binding domain-containing protein n=1 Tax=Paspalum notatum var. saurae TaxID=547442 RepID=A0AAQ3UI11_PASNO